MTIGLIREGKIPADNRVALTPAQCRWLKKNRTDISIIVQPCETRCFSDKEYELAGAVIKENVDECNILFGIKEIPVAMLLENKTYLFFSHTKKLQAYNQKMLQELMIRKNTLIDYECLEHEDGKRIIGFGFFAGIVGAHNGLMAFGRRTGSFHLDKINSNKAFRQLLNTYFGLRLPNIKIAVTGSGRVAHGVLEIMNLLGINEVEPEEFLTKEFSYPAYVHLKGANLYQSAIDGSYNRDDFHANPENYKCGFTPFLAQTDILMNGVYWDKNVPRLFELEDMRQPDFRIQTIADITDDQFGSVPCNLGDSTIQDPVYGVNKESFERTAPYVRGSVDMMAVGNLPNELPRDASSYFGEQLIKHILKDLFDGNQKVIEKATIVKNGKLTSEYAYMQEYAEGRLPSS